MNETTKKIIGGLVGGLILGGVGGMGLHASLMEPITIEKPVITEVIKKVEVPVVTKEIEYVDKIVEVPIETIVEVDNSKGNLDMMVDYLIEADMDDDSELGLIMDGLDEDDVEEIVDRMMYVKELKADAIKAIKLDLFDELDNTEVDNISLDDRDMERLKIDDDDDEIFIDEIDFDDSDARVRLTGTFEQDDVKFDWIATVKFRDGEYDELDDIGVSRRE